MKITIDIDPTEVTGAATIPVSEMKQAPPTMTSTASEGTPTDAGACAGLPRASTPSLAPSPDGVPIDAGPAPFVPTHPDYCGLSK